MCFDRNINRNRHVKFLIGIIDHYTALTKETYFSYYTSFLQWKPLLPDHNNGVKPENRLCNVHRWWIQDIFGLLASILLKGLQILDRLYCRGWDGHLGYVQQLQLHLPHQLTTWKIKFWNRNYRMKFNDH